MQPTNPWIGFSNSQTLKCVFGVKQFL